MRAEDEEVVVIGAGIVGLACAAELARRGRSVLVVERHDRIATETSSRNSGVVHAGIYYPPGSLKARTCVQGRELLYARCAQDGVPHRKVGKLIVACDESEVATLEKLCAQGANAGAGALELLDGAQVTRLEPRVRAIAGLLSPESGIVDAHELARSHRADCDRFGVRFAMRTRIVAIDQGANAWIVRDETGSCTARAIVNAAGLEADAIAALAGLDVDALGWRIRPCKGDYFAISKRLGPISARLIYPVPQPAGLGVHVTMDLAGAFRAGPDATYVETPRYDVSADKAEAFAGALARYLPGILASDLAPDYAGVRPKLQGPGEPFRDFVIEERPAGLLHLIGVESPGLTAAEAIARLAADRLS